MGRPRVHDEQTRLALLDAAEILIARGGLEAVSVRAVAHEIGVSVRAVYSVFGSKDGLIRGLAQRGFELLMEKVDSAPLTSHPDRDLVNAALKGFRPFALEHPDLFQLIFVGPGIDLGPNAGEASALALSRLAQRLERAREAGITPDRPINELALEFHALCQGLADVELGRPLPLGLADRMWSDTFDDLLAGWQSRAKHSVSPPPSRRLSRQ